MGTILLYGLGVVVVAYAGVWLYGSWTLSGAGLPRLRSSPSIGDLVAREEAEQAMRKARDA
ncbi:hypothetical protein [Mesorhizobium sp. B2-3-4]|uniref:hypothetical protein n=1 Tax=Mesorhizobium sp. B2-3-4 TaxID=2589959 RepID=UPI00112BB12B|nr:hypothetical protein [Mesorhizobium sp. B2-3-4]TPM31458.1 hypothetical protein FJ967_24775 [Mesorhizobium sp. B2-3-4]